MNPKVKGKIIKFQKDVFWSFVFNGAFQRGKIYAEAKKEETKDLERNKTDFKEFLKTQLENFREVYYFKDLSDKAHFDLIWEFKEKVTSKFKDKKLFKDDKFRFGTAQKLFNLYLKMEWVFNDNERPPLHCPFDRIVAVVILKEDFNWTIFHGKDDKAVCFEKYQTLVDIARIEAKLVGLSIAEWELIAYDEYINKSRNTPSV